MWNKLITKGTNKAFKIRIPFEQRDAMHYPEFWSDSVLSTFKTTSFHTQGQSEALLTTVSVLILHSEKYVL